jgi:hypothetical protein
LQRILEAVEQRTLWAQGGVLRDGSENLPHGMAGIQWRWGGGEPQGIAGVTLRGDRVPEGVCQGRSGPILCSAQGEDRQAGEGLAGCWGDGVSFKPSVGNSGVARAPHPCCSGKQALLGPGCLQ